MATSATEVARDMIPAPNVVAGLLIGLANTSWLAVIGASFLWPVVFCAYVAATASARRQATVADFRLRARRLLLGSPTLSFYGIEAVVALTTSLPVACVTFLVKRLVA